nr:cytoplasmic protein [Cryptococcus depauperatus CBS 7855]
MSQEKKQKSLDAFVSFPSPYTQTLLVQALAAAVPCLSLTLVQPAALQWADYDLMSFDIPHKNPSQYLISSYIYRKALIRKHELHHTIASYLAKCRHRQTPSVLAPVSLGADGGVLGGGAPRGWTVDVQFADELDEALMDDLFELSQEMKDNEGKGDGERRWWILKPGFADRAQGIRLFSTEDELRAIFEEFEPASEDGASEDGADEDGDERELEDTDDRMDRLAKKTVEMGLAPEGTGVVISQLRHFVIQASLALNDYIPRPMLFDIAETPGKPLAPLTGYKFHLRAYVLVTGAYTVHLAKTMLALFSGSLYTPPRVSDDGKLDLGPHLTNTCLQTDVYGAPVPAADLVKLFYELEGLTVLTHSSKPSTFGKYTYEPQGRVTKEWLDTTFEKVGDVVSETIKAGAECGSFGLQFMPNAFEIFGVDLILSFPPSVVEPDRLPIPVVTLLEFNASPDFYQSGDRLRPQLLEMFKGVVNISIVPFFGLSTRHDEVDDTAMKVGDEKWGWRMVGKGEVRGSDW